MNENPEYVAIVKACKRLVAEHENGSNHPIDLQRVEKAIENFREGQKKELAESEMSILKKVLDMLEEDTYYQQGLDGLSGGFSIAEMKGYDEVGVDIELKWGIQDGSENTVHTEQFSLQRCYLEVDEDMDEEEMKDMVKEAFENIHG